MTFMFAMVSGAENKRYTAVPISDKIRFIETPSMAMPAPKGRANFLNQVRLSLISYNGTTVPNWQGWNEMKRDGMVVGMEKGLWD